MTEDFEGSRTEFMKMLAEQDSPPAYLTRAQHVESIWRELLERCRAHRVQLQEMPRTRLAQLAHLIDHQWASLAHFVSADMTSYLAQLHAEWKPTLRAELSPTTNARRIHAAMHDLRKSFSRFNQRWVHFVHELSLDELNYQRSQYNEYYLVEKAAALGSDKLAEMGFEKLPLVVAEDILVEIPLLRVPD